MPAATPRPQVRISVVLFALTVTAAAVDAVTFLGLGHAFAALATGNILLLGFGVAQAGPILRPAAALAAFLTGVTAAHLLIVRVSARGRRWFIVVLAAEAAASSGRCFFASGPAPR